MQFCRAVSGHSREPFNVELCLCTVLFNDDVTCVEWSIYYMWPCIIQSSDQMTKIYIGVI